MESHGLLAWGEVVFVDVEAELERFLADYGPWLKGRIRRICPRDMGIVAEDLEQEVRVRLWKALQRERTLHNPTSYLHRVVSTVTIDAMRGVRMDRDRHERDDRDDDPGDELHSVESAAPSPEQKARRSEMLRRARQFVDELPVDRRRAVGLYLQGFKIQEIAELAHWTEPKARNLLYRGLSTLRQSMAEAGMSHEDL